MYQKQNMCFVEVKMRAVNNRLLITNCPIALVSGWKKLLTTYDGTVSCLRVGGGG
jgi:hypothetical protein